MMQYYEYSMCVRLSTAILSVKLCCSDWYFLELEHQNCVPLYIRVH